MTVKIRKRKRKTSTSIMLDYTGANGKRVQRVFGRASTPEALAMLEDAAFIEAKRIELRSLLESGIIRRDGLTLRDAFEDFRQFYEKTTAAESTKAAYWQTMYNFERGQNPFPSRLLGITPQTAIAFIQWRTKEGRAPGTVKGDVTRLSRIWKRLVEQGHCDSNPWRHSDVVAVTPAAGMHERAFTDDELKRFLDFLDDEMTDPEKLDFWEFFLILSETGLRSGELLSLRYCTVSCHDENPWISIEAYNGWKPKTTKSSRRIPISMAAAQEIYSRSRITDDDYVFSREWTNSYVSKYFNKALKAANLDAPDARYGQKLRVHSLRHYYATKLVTGGVDVATIRDLLGHASITTTNRYFNAPPEAATRAVENVFGRQK